MSIVLETSDDVQLRVPLRVAMMSVFIKSVIGDDDIDEDTTIPLPNVRSSILKKVIEFCTHYLTPGQKMPRIAKPLISEDLSQCGIPAWYVDFVDQEQVVLFDFILAAEYLNIEPLLDLTCAKVGSMIKGKTTDEIRSVFNIADDFGDYDLSDTLDERLLDFEIPYSESSSSEYDPEDDDDYETSSDNFDGDSDDSEINP